MAQSKVSVRLYPSGSGVVLIGMDWTPPKGDPFFGFAIRRTPGFHEPIPFRGKPVQSNFSWLENRLSFNGKPDVFTPSNIAPIQKFQWWDARFHPQEDAGKKFTYEVMPMAGQPDALVPVSGAAGSASLTFPARDTAGVGIWFNRPFVSSQAFARLLQRLRVDPEDPSTLTDRAKAQIYAWLGNDLEKAVPQFVSASKGAGLAGAIYHLTDSTTIAALTERSGSMVLHWKNPTAKGAGDTTDKKAEVRLKKANWQTVHRQSGNLMHNKILVENKGKKPGRLLMGSANFTLEAYTTQANVLHVWKNPALSAGYRDRVEKLIGDPTPASLSKSARWSAPIPLGGGADLKVFFSPESDQSKKTPTWSPASIKPIVDAIKSAKSSIVFCLYDPTDEDLLNAVLDAITKNRAAFGLLNTLPGSAPKPTTKAGKKTPNYAIKKRLYEFTNDHNEIVSAQGYLSPLTGLPQGWLAELNALPSAKKQTAGSFDFSTIHVHHKFVLIDGETNHPILFTGSANLSKNSSTRNDENTLWITGHTPLAQTYLAEFMRLFEHYRSRPTKRAGRGKDMAGKTTRPPLRLDATGQKWWPKYFKPSPSATARRSFGT